MEPFSFASSSDLDFSAAVRINNLVGHEDPLPFSTLLERPELKHRGSNISQHSELYVTVQVWADSKPLTVPVQTAYRTFTQKRGREWNEWLTLPIKYTDAPATTQLAITVWDLSPVGGPDADGHAIPFGGTTVPLFDKDSTLQKGRIRCTLHRHKAADGLSDTTTPYIIPPARRRNEKGKVEEAPVDAEMKELERLEALMKKHEMNEIAENKWLDQMVFRQVEKLEQRVMARHRKNARSSNGANLDGTEHHSHVLYIEFPRFDHPIVFTDYEYPAPPISTTDKTHQQLSASDVRLKPPPEIQFGPGINTEGEGYGESDGIRLIRIFDPEVGTRDNPAENKHRRLVRNRRTGVLDQDLKPNAKIRDELNIIMSYGPTEELNPEEKDLVWKFRHHLTRDKRALTKFVKSITWNDAGEVRQAIAMLPRWTEIDIDDALELLGPEITNPDVRAHGVARLRKSDDEELQVYLLQLVQALKFEQNDAEVAEDAADSSLARFLVSRAANNLQLGIYFHWYLMVEIDDRSAEQGQEYRQLYSKVEYEFQEELLKSPDGEKRRKTLLRQGELITVLSKISKEVRFSREDRTRKIERLKKFLADPANEMNRFDPPLPLPLDPSVEVVSCYPDEANVFKSSLFPLLVHFKTADGKKYPVIFKTGDDLRQDQLIVQIITLMDRLLRKENLDLKLSPYRILATGATAGCIQFVPSTSLAAAMTKYRNSILAYLRANNPDESAPLGVRKEAMDTYVKSCAGYCVITYILGVGDRHLDNLLLSPDGHFFHADFGYILGRDPKPFAPPMKLSKEMVEGMGGDASPNFAAFKQYCFTAYTTLRKQSNLILNLFALMVNANIPDIRLEPDKAVLKVKERFRLDLSEEEAIRHFETLIGDSVSAIIPVVIDRVHGFVQHWRA